MDDEKRDVANAMQGSRRPALGTLFAAAVFAWIAALAAEELTWIDYVDGLSSLLGVIEPAGELLLVLCVLALLVPYIRAKIWAAFKTLLPVVLCGVCVFACSLLFWRAWAVDCTQVADALKSGDGLEVELTSDPSIKDYGTVSEGVSRIDGRSVRLRILWPEGADVLSAGHAVVVCGALKLPGDDGGGRWNHQQGFVGMVSAASAHEAGVASGPRGWVAGFRDKAMSDIESLGGGGASLLAGVVLGNRTLYAGSELEQDFRTTGLAHLMAVSGTHLAVVTAIAAWVLRRTRAGPTARDALLALLLGIYVALTCFAASALRAYVMCLAALGASRFSRRGHPLSALSACVFLFLATTPRLAFSLGFELSVLCMVGILGLSPLVADWLRACVPRKLGSLTDGVAATLTANLATLPVTIPLFCQLPLISPLSTLVASPLVTAALALGIPGILLAQIVPPAGTALLHLGGLVAGACALVVGAMADVPMACVALDSSAPWVAAVFLAIGILLWTIWPKPPEGACARRGVLAKTRAVVGIAALSPVLLVLLVEFGGVYGGANLLAPGTVASGAEVVMLDVGQGDAMLIRDGDAAVLVDTGEEPTVLLKALARHGVSRLDAVLLSHKDIDHTGALSALAGVVDVGHVYIHADLLDAPSCEKVRQAASWTSRHGSAEGVRRGDSIQVGRFGLLLLGPERGGDSENDDSLIWLLSFVDLDNSIQAKGLLTGDGEEEALASVLDAAGDIDFLKVGHHGSADAVSNEEMRTLRPELSLISVGADNDYGHPTQQTLGVLEHAGSKVLRTDLCGDITLSFGDGQLRVSYQKS